MLQSSSEADDELERTELEIQQLAGEETKKKDEEERRDEGRWKKDARRREEEIGKKKADIQEEIKKVQAARRQEDEVLRKTEEFNRQEEEAKQRAVQLEHDTERMKQMQLEAQNFVEYMKKTKEEILKKDMEMKEREDILRRREAELIRREAMQEAKQREEARKDADARRREEEVGKRESEIRRMAEEVAKMRAEAKRKERETRMKEQDAREKEETAQRKEGEVIRKTEELNRKEEQGKQRAAQLEQETDRMKQMQLAVQNFVEDLKKMKEEALKKDIKMKDRENILRAREAVLIHREADNFHRIEEARRKEEAKQQEVAARQQETRNAALATSLQYLLREQEEKHLQNESQHPDDMQEQLRVLRRAKFRKWAEDIQHTREEHERSDSVGNDNAQSGSSRYLFVSPGTSPDMSRTHQFNNGPFIREQSPGPSTGGRGGGKQQQFSESREEHFRHAQEKLEAERRQNSAGRPISHGELPTRGSANIAFLSKARKQEFFGSQQEQYHHAQEIFEVQRHLQPAGIPLFPEKLQQVFEHHERLWTRLKTLKELSWNDFPWPMATQPLNPDDISLFLIEAYIHSPLYPGKSRTPQDRIKDHIKRWHPDSFEAKLRKVVENDRGKVKLGAEIIARCLSQLLEKEKEKEEESK
jgi:hypothetical protein